MAAVVGFAFLWLSVTPVGKRVFLIVVAAIPNAMLRMTTTSGMVQKAARWPFKKAAVGGKKTADCKPLPNPPQGAGIRSRCVLGGCDCASFLEKGWYGVFVLNFFLPLGEGKDGACGGRGAPLATL